MARPPYAPWRDGPPRFAPKLSPIAAEHWLRPDAEAGWLAAKAQLIAERPADVLAQAPGSDPSLAAGLASLMSEQGFEVGGAGDAALLAASRLVSDDFCLLARDDAGMWRLAHACVCAPTFWRLADVIGQPLAAIHGPVPGGDPGLAARISRVFDAVPPDVVLERFNWTVQPGPARFTPDSRFFAPAVAAIPPGREASSLHVRVERQTVRRLPASGASTGGIVFTIRVSLDPLDAVFAAGDRSSLEAAWRGADASVRGYKRWDVLEGAVSAALGSAA